jgi:hypothetical protein
VLHHIVYGSSIKEPLGPDTLSGIIETSVRNNARDGITGVLLYHDQLFFQILEGERSCVERCFSRIVCDKRHFGVHLMWNDIAEERLFPEWAMGFAGPDQIDGFNNASFQHLGKFLGAQTAMAEADVVTLALARHMFKRFMRDLAPFEFQLRKVS